MIFAESPHEEEQAYRALLPLQRDDFVGIFRAMDGLPVTVRLLDPPLHEFLPDHVEVAVDGRARREERGEIRPGARRGRVRCSRRSRTCTRRTRCSASAASGWGS